MTTSVSPALLLPKLQPYLKNRNPRVRAKASMCFCKCVPRLVSRIASAFFCLVFFFLLHSLSSASHAFEDLLILVFRGWKE